LTATRARTLLNLCKEFDFSVLVKDLECHTHNQILVLLQ